MDWDAEGGWLPRQHDFGSGARRGDDGERSADPLRTLLHAGQTEPGAEAFFGDAATIVGYGEAESDGARGRRVNLDVTGARMTDGIRQRLLGDGDDLTVDGRAELRHLLDHQLDRHIGRAPRQLGRPFQNRGDIDRVDVLRAQRTDRTTGFDHVRAREIDRRLDAL